jgi:glycerate 2-kinase
LVGARKASMHETVAPTPLCAAHAAAADWLALEETADRRSPAQGWNDEPGGLAERMAARHGGRTYSVLVTGPLGEVQRAMYVFLEFGDDAVPGVPLAVIEASSALGRTGSATGWPRLVGASSYGLGELIRAALNGGAQRILLDCDDSAALDGGAGMAQALGARLLDRRGWPIGHGAVELGRLARIDLSRLDPRLARVRMQAAVDWSLTLLGPSGVVDAQRGRFGADEAASLTAALERYALRLFDATGVEVANLPGGGSAGGAAAAAGALLGARLVPRGHWASIT